jgi:hypothetical protein
MVGRREIHVNGGKYIARGVENSQLRDALRQLCRHNARIGDGSTMDAVHAEVKAGCRLFDCKHYQKALDRRRQLITTLSADLSTVEREVASELIERLNKAVSAAAGGR